MQAIRTVILPATAHHYTRVKATCAAKSITCDYDHDLKCHWEVNHRIVAERLVTMLGWTTEGYGTLVSGCLSDGSYCHVLTGRDGKGG